MVYSKKELSSGCRPEMPSAMAMGYASQFLLFWELLCIVVAKVKIYA